jgi:DNA-binding winged helix-turn-helix (wHTH) protein/tetratricopeptide (TPR) repeat protein
VKPEQHVFFPPFHLDLVNEQLWRGTELLPLRPKVFAVLRCLVAHAGQLVTREELRQTVWPDTVGTEGLPKESIHELRDILGDEVKAPCFIETMGRRGYRFVAVVTRVGAGVQSPERSGGVQDQEKIRGSGLGADAPQLSSLKLKTSNLVGREAELVQLEQWLEKARQGERQVVFVTGEPGIGKTSVVDAFSACLADFPKVWIARGQCIEHYGEGEAYLPVLEALGRLSRQAGVERFVEFLGRYAPTWLAQMPRLIGEAEFEALQRRVQGATQQRMLREIVEAVEICTTGEAGYEAPLLVLVLEDLQWSDYSTLDLISSFARRREPARLMLIGTYRPAEGLADGHPLRAVTQELRGHGQCQELTLSLLSEAAVGEYVEKRFPASPLPSRLPQVLSQLTGGNPLFLVTVVDDLIDRGSLVHNAGSWMLQGGLQEVTTSVPENIRQLIGRQIERLSAKEQHIVEAASVAGLEFSAAVVAAAAEVDVVAVEACCEALVRRKHFLQSVGYSDWPDGTRAARYRFCHALYQYLWHERVPVNQRQQLHQRIGERQEIAYGQRAGEIAAELAIHFEQGRDYERAVLYLRQAATTAIQRHAYHEAITHLTRGLDLLKTLPATLEHTQNALSMYISLGTVSIATKGFTAPEVEYSYAQAREICDQFRGTPEVIPVLWGLQAFHHVRAKLQTARQLSEQCLRLAHALEDPSPRALAHFLLGTVLHSLGNLVEAHEHLTQSMALYDARPGSAQTIPGPVDPRKICQSYVAWTLWLLGYPDQAQNRNQVALSLTPEQSHVNTLAQTLHFGAILERWCGKWQAARAGAKEVITFAVEQELPNWLALGNYAWGYALVGQGQLQEGIPYMRQGSDAYKAIGAALGLSGLLGTLAEAYGSAGQSEEGLRVVDEAFAVAQKNEELTYEAELCRTKGELILRQSKAKGRRLRLEEEAEEYLERACTIARRQSAKSFELRAAISLSRLWQRRGKTAQARQLLGEVYGWFTEGFTTVDLQTAATLLAELSEHH